MERVLGRLRERLNDLFKKEKEKRSSEQCKRE